VLDRAFTLFKYKADNLFAKIAEEKIQSAYNRLVLEGYQPEVLFIPSQFPVDDDSLFFDTDHLNGKAARRFSLMLSGLLKDRAMSIPQP